MTFEHAILRQEEVVGLHVAVDHAVVVHHREGVGGLDGDGRAIVRQST
jgi:hypothetical protein